jgi:para-aminobenzoate synthetase component 1
MNLIALEPRPWQAPIEVLQGLGDRAGVCAFLSGGGGHRARWSYVLARPERFLRIAGEDRSDLFGRLTDFLGPRLPLDPEGPPFQGGLAGLAAYEMGDRIEPLNAGRHADGWPDLAVGSYPSLLAFDHQQRQVLAIGRGETRDQARGRALEAAGDLEFSAGPLFPDRLSTGSILATPGDAYERDVAEVVSRIHSGEIFQANIARVWRGRLSEGARPIDLLGRLAGDSPAPFAGWLNLGDLALVSNSPERFVTLDAARDSRIETRPIKGTRRRGATPAEDMALVAELRASGKDQAENLMIVDLMRNDLARVSPPGAVRTPELFAVESFVNVHHLVSTVTARLSPGLTAIDLLRAAFPPGSVTGAPKVQAMKVIQQLEPPRGPYCGSLFWAGFDGSLDSSVLIRTAAFARQGEGWRWEARAGAGLVAESDPREERLETEAKIGALLNALSGGRP